MKILMKCFLKINNKYPEKSHELDNDLSIFPERMIIEKVEKILTNLYVTEEYVIPNFKLNK